MLLARLAAVWRRIDFNVEIPPVLFTTVPRFGISALVGGLMGLLGGVPLAIFLGLYFGLMMASPMFGPERLRRAKCMNPSQRRKRAFACMGVVASLEILVLVVLSTLVQLPLSVSMLLVAAVVILLLCMSGFINLLVEVLRIGNHIARREKLSQKR